MKASSLKSQAIESALGLLIAEDRLWLCLFFRQQATGREAGTPLLLSNIARHPGQPLVAQLDEMLQECKTQVYPAALPTVFWFATDQAQCLSFPLSAQPDPGVAMHLEVAAQLSGDLAAHIAEKDTKNETATVTQATKDNWLQDAVPSSPPIFDYVLRDAGASSYSSSVTPEAWLWWAPQGADQAVAVGMEGSDMHPAGMVPDGIALYRGLVHRWRQRGVEAECLSGNWVLLDSSEQQNAWFFSGCYFRERQPRAGTGDSAALALTSEHKVVIWGDVSECALALISTLDRDQVLDSNLQPWGAVSGERSVDEDLQFVLVRGLALLGLEPKTEDWHSLNRCPEMNLLPWRGERLQHLQQRTRRQLVAGLCVVLAAALFVKGLAIQHLDAAQTRLTELQQHQHEQDLAVHLAEADKLQEAQDGHARKRLWAMASVGAQQLERLQRLLTLLPRCTEVTQVVMTDTAIMLSGVARDLSGLHALPERTYSGFAADNSHRLDAWPVLLFGSQASDVSSNADVIGGFVLQVSFAQHGGTS